MVISSLSVINYKNIAQADLAFSPKINCFIGSNGEGKTNLLDAVYYLSFCRSSNTPLDAQVVRHEQDSMAIQGVYMDDDGNEEVISAGEFPGKRKRFCRNRKPYQRLAEHIGLVPLVMVSPQDNVLVTGGGEERRKFLDTVISQYDNIYLDSLIKYNRALQQRNVLLRGEAEPDPTVISIFEEIMAAEGEIIFSKRRSFVELLTPIFQDYYTTVSSGKEKVELVYTSHCMRGPLLDVIQRDRVKDRIMGYSLHGIHRDELDMRLDGYPIRREGSQGQAKSFLVALNHACSTIATGGFSPYNTSVAYFDSPLIEGVLAFFMMISSANFGMYVAAWKRGPKVILHDTEFRTYVGLVVAATVLMAANLASAQGWAWNEAFRQSFFQAASLSSSTGFISSDFDKWPAFSQFILVFLIFVGGCAGSTAGGLKVTRLMLLVKTIVLRIRQKMHPHLVLHVRSNGEDFSEDVLYGVARFFFVYVMLDILWTVLLVFDGIPIFDALGVAITTMGSCGPSFGLFGATCTYADMPSFSKAVVCLSMLMGRLEIFPVLALLMPSFWKHRVW